MGCLWPPHRLLALLPGNAFTYRLGETDRFSVFIILLVSYAHTRNHLGQLYALISSRIIYDYIKIEGVEGDAEVTQKGEEIGSDYFSLLMKTINVNNM